MDISLMAIGTQFTGSNLRNEIAHSLQQSFTWVQQTDTNSRVAGAQRTDIRLRVETICPYPQDPRKTRQMSYSLRAINTQRTSVHLRAVDKQWTNVNLRVVIK